MQKALTDDFDGNGNQLMQQEGATFTVNGETREYADIWHKKQDESSSETSEDEGFSYSTESQINEVFYNFYTNNSENLKSNIENIKNNSITTADTDKLLEQETSKKSINFFGLLNLEEENKEIA